MPAEENSNLDKELEKAKRDLRKNPPLTREDYRKALKAAAKRHNMTVEEFEQMLAKDGF